MVVLARRVVRRDESDFIVNSSINEKGLYSPDVKPIISDARAAGLREPINPVGDFPVIPIQTRVSVQMNFVQFAKDLDSKLICRIVL